MCIYLKNDCAKFHPDLIWNVRAFGFFEEVTPTRRRRRRWRCCSNRFNAVYRGSHSVTSSHMYHSAYFIQASCNHVYGLLTSFMYWSRSHCWTNVLLISIGFFLASRASDTEQANRLSIITTLSSTLTVFPNPIKNKRYVHVMLWLWSKGHREQVYSMQSCLLYTSPSPRD